MQRTRQAQPHHRVKQGPANIIDWLRPDHLVLPLHHQGKTIHQIAVETDIPAWIVIKTLRKRGLIQ